MFEEDLDLHGNQYNTAISVFFIGYILTQISDEHDSRQVQAESVPADRDVLLGHLSTYTGAVHDYGGLIALRFILGSVQAPFFPGALFLLSLWYTKKELTVRISVLYAAGQMAGAFGGLLDRAIILGMRGAGGLPAWRWLFTIEGVITIPVAVVAVFVLPD